MFWWYLAVLLMVSVLGAGAVAWQTKQDADALEAHVRAKLEPQPPNDYEPAHRDRGTNWDFLTEPTRELPIVEPRWKMNNRR